MEQSVASGMAEKVADVHEPRYRYAPNSELASILEILAHQYAVDLVGVTSLIHSRVDKRALHFANAFRWKKDN